MPRLPLLDELKPDERVPVGDGVLFAVIVVGFLLTALVAGWRPA